MFFEDQIKKARDWYLQLKHNCSKCNGTGFIQTSGRTCVDCDCTKFYDKYKYLIKMGLDIRYIEGKMGKIEELFSKSFEKNILELKHNYFVEDLSKILVISETEMCHSSEFLANYLFEFIGKKVDSCLIDFNRLLNILCGFDEEFKENEFIEYNGIIIIKNIPNYHDKYLSNNQSYQHSKIMKFFNTRKYNNRTIICGDLSINQIKELYTREIFIFLYDNFLHFEFKNNNARKSAYKELNQKNPKLSKLFNQKKIERPQAKKSKPSKHTGRKLI